MLHPKWSTKFELKPGKWVFVPTSESIEEGRKIKKAIEDYWEPPRYYYHLRSGGHVEAIKSHLKHNSFLHFDIQDFFGSINRSRVTRTLIGKFSYENARAMAHASTVRHPDEKSRLILPYGFIQSQIVAALCLNISRLGKYLNKLSKNSDVSLSVYVDDIIVSCNDSELSASILVNITNAAENANFILNAAKQEGPAAAITAFNIMLQNNSMMVEALRLKKFVDVLKETESEYQREGILSYVKSINVAQGFALKI